MKYLHLAPSLHLIPKSLIAFLFFMLLFPSCNNEELYVLDESAFIEEEEVPDAEEEPDNGTVAPVVPVDAVDDAYTTFEDSPVTIEAYLNDENLPSNFTVSNTNPSNGVLTINDNSTPDNLRDDSIVYTPNPGFFGTDSFEYTVCDVDNADNCDTAIVTIVVEEVIDNDIATELKAFPSALGDGAYATGGRGGIVVHVTNLNDSGEGSLREALRMTVPRIIVFDVSGVINLNSHIGLGESNNNVTIAGQTAPEGGITIDGGRFYINSANNVIVRHVRFKGGDSDNNDSVSVTGEIQNQIWDHCSFGFGTDEGASFYSGNARGTNQNKVTIQRCLWNENSKGAILGKVTANGGTPPTGSFISNLFYNSGYRFPNLSSSGIGQFDVINNVAWNVSARLIRGNGAFNLNHIGNYYNYGTFPIRDNRTHLFAHGTIPKIYNMNNKIVAQSTSSPLTHTVDEMNNDGNKSWGFFQDGGGFTYGDRLPNNYFTSSQHPLLGKVFSPLTAEEALLDVMNNVGCNARLNADGSVSENLDVLDANALFQVSQGNYIDKLEKANYNVPFIQSITRPVGYDTDRDGMPDVWEISRGFNPNLADDDGDDDNDGYTNIEEFLNQVDQ